MSGREGNGDNGILDVNPLDWLNQTVNKAHTRGGSLKQLE